MFFTTDTHFGDHRAPVRPDRDPRLGIGIFFADEDAAVRFVARILARRASAPKQIGVHYVSRTPYELRPDSIQMVAVND